MKLVRKVGITGLFFVLAFTLTSAPVLNAQVNTQADGAPKQVLYLNAYHKGYKWSDDITQGIVSVLGIEGERANLSIEYMDTKRMSDEAYLRKLYELYKLKYSQVKFDVIMSSDDAALNFLFEYADDLFPGVPVVFCGANFFDERRLAGHPLVTGVSEEADLKGTLDIALKLNPQTRRVVIVNDTSVTGQNVHRGMDAIIPDYPQITFSWLEDVTMDEARQYVSQLPPESIVLLTLFFKDKAGAFFEYDAFTSLIAQSSAVPVYATWDFSLGYGAVGGKLTSGHTEGERAARIAQRILHGEQPAAIPVVKEAQSRYMFDYNQLLRWGIRTSDLPADSIVINRSVSFYETYRTIVWVVIISFVVLAAIVLFLFVNVLQRRQAEARLSESNRELQTVRLSLEERVQERTAELAQRGEELETLNRELEGTAQKEQRRAAQLAASAQVAHAISQVRDLDQLLSQVTHLISQVFGYYHVGIFIVDELRRFAVLRAANSEGGQRMLARNHKLAVGAQGIVGYITSTGQPRIALDVGADAIHFDNPDLPQTRSEMALPLRVGDQVIGALDAQSTQEAAFTEDDVAVLGALADQTSIAIENARLFTETNAALQEARETQARYAGQEWEKLGAFLKTTSFEYRISSIPPVGDAVLPEIEQAIQNGKAVTHGPASPGDLVQAALAVPIKMGGQPIGVIDLHDTDTERKWTDDDIALVAAIADQAALALENARLFQQTQQRARRERLIADIAAKMRAAPDVESILRTTVREIRRALGTSHGVIRLETTRPPQATE